MNLVYKLKHGVTAALFQSVILASFPAEVKAGPLDKTATFTPSVTFTESQTEKFFFGTFQINDDPPEVSRGVESTLGVSISISASMAGFTPAEVDAGTTFSVEVGGVSISGQLGDDPFYYQGKSSIFIPNTRWDGITGKPTSSAGLRMSWTATKLTITVKNPLVLTLNSNGDPTYDEYGDIVVEDTMEVAIRDWLGQTNNPARSTTLASVAFGPLETTNRIVYASGKSATADYHFPSENPTDYTLNNVSLSGGADYGIPTVSVVTPKSGTFTGPNVSITGKATDGYNIEAVEYALNPDPTEPDWVAVDTLNVIPLANPALLWGATTATWTLDLADMPIGTNKLWLRSRDNSGNNSATLVLTYVNPVTIALRGRWDGLLTPDQAQGIAGSVSYTVSSNGYYTGKILLEDGTFGFDGYVDPTTGRASDLIVRANRPDLILTADIFGAETNADGLLIVGSLDDDTDATLAAFQAHRSPYTSAALAPVEFAGRFHANTVAPTAVTLGHSTFVITTARAGTASAVARLADGTSFTWSGYIGLLNGDAMLPVFYPLYGGKGSLSALLTIDGTTRTIPLATTDWVRPTSVADKQFPTGFTLALDTRGTTYTAPPITPKTRVMGLGTANPNAQITLTGNALPTPLVQDFYVKDTNAITMPTNTQAIAHSFIASTGMSATGSFKLPSTTTVATMHYLIVGTHAYGYYIAPAATGTVAKRYGTVLWGAP